MDFVGILCQRLSILSESMCLVVVLYGGRRLRLVLQRVLPLVLQEGIDPFNKHIGADTDQKTGSSSYEKVMDLVVRASC